MRKVAYWLAAMRKDTAAVHFYYVKVRSVSDSFVIQWDGVAATAGW
jgi:hypothetical protein